MTPLSDGLSCYLALNSLWAERTHLWTTDRTEKHLVGIAESPSTVIFMFGHRYEAIYS